ncbi:hypothetical protein [Limosilactobacillus reuteri]|nr:hypothetical protein [Limosilactobacillus reuteri]
MKLLKFSYVIEGISNRQLAKKFAGNPVILQQGFFWGKGTAYFNYEEKVN